MGISSLNPVTRPASLSRRTFVKELACLGMLAAVPKRSRAAAREGLRYNIIPATGEKIPAVGMGTWITFNVGSDVDHRNHRTEVLRTFFDMGGGMVDSSPMYGSAEEVLGYCLNRIGKPHPSLFSATKVWTPFKGLGKKQMDESFRLWGVDKMDLFQVHNLLNWDGHLPELLKLKKQGRVRYVGVTTSHGRRHEELLEVLNSQPLDFVQLTYNILDREVEEKLLPAAQKRKIAVIANRPFQGGDLFDRVEGKPLPSWAKHFECHNWAQFFLKFIISHPAITCAIPATSQVPHMKENMGALRGSLPDAKTRRKMAEVMETL